MTNFCSMFESKVSFVQMFYFIGLMEEREGGCCRQIYEDILGVSWDTRISEDIRIEQDET